MLTRLRLSDLLIDPRLQQREAIDHAVVVEYATRMRDGGIFPPLTVFVDGASRWLVDGFHRYRACVAAGIEEADCDARPGTQRDALLFSCGANAEHGLRRSNEDKRRAVLVLLADAEWSQWSDREIARQCNVDHKTVARCRAEHLGNSPDSAMRTAERGGTTYEQDTTNIGKSAPAPRLSEAQAPRDEPPRQPVEPDTSQEDADEDLVTLLERSYAENDDLRKQLEAAQADDKVAEIIKWQRATTIARNAIDDVQGKLVAREAELKRVTGWIRRIGKAVGEDDPTKVAATVEMFVRVPRREATA